MNIYWNNKPNFKPESLLGDFKVFMAYIWYSIHLPPPTEMQLEIADFIQGKDSRLLLEAFRGIGKTHIAGAYCAWRLLRNPNEKVLIISQTSGHADKIAVFLRNLLSSVDILKHLEPSKDDRDTIKAFNVSNCNISVQESVKSLGILSQLQGNRATLILSDDVEGQKNSITEAQREKLVNAMAEYEAILQTDDGCQIILLGTPQSFESVYNKYRDELGYKTRIFPARFPERIELYGEHLAPYLVAKLRANPLLVGQPTDTRFTDEILATRAIGLGASGFNLQFMLDTTLSDANKYPLKLKDLIVMDLDREYAPKFIFYSSAISNKLQIDNIGFSGDGFYSPASVSYTDMQKYDNIILGIDPKGRGTDAIGYVILAYSLGRLFLLDGGSIKGGYDEESLIRISHLALEYNVNEVCIESNFGDGMYTALLTPILLSIHKCAITELKVSKNKEARIIDILEPITSNHRLIVSKELVEKDVAKAKNTSEIDSKVFSLFYQYSHISKVSGSLQKDDAIDILASIANKFTSIMKVNPIDIANHLVKKKREEELKSMLKGIKPPAKKFNIWNSYR